MKYLSICSGIEAATVAWEGLGWTPLAFSEIEAFPRAVLQHHYPDVPLHGDFTKLRDEPWIGDADILVGGTPCQAFSIAGLRNSLDDERGNLTLEFVRLANAIDDVRSSGTIIVWENVPGVLSVKDNAFGCFLAALVGDDAPLVPPRGKWSNAGLVAGPKRRAAWRVLDAQYFGLAQRRRRVFVVASARDDFDPAEVLFEREGVQRHTAPRRETGQGFAADVAQCLVSSGRGVERTGDTRGQDNVVAVYQDAFHCLNADGMGRIDYETESFVIAPQAFRTSGNCGAWATGDRVDALTTGTDPNSHLVAHALRASHDGSEDGTGRGTPLVPVTIPVNETVGSLCAESGPNTHGSRGLSGGQTLLSGYIQPVAYDMRGREGGAQFEGPHDTANIRAASGGSSRSYIAHAIQAGALRENLNSGPDGVGVQADIAYTLEARAEVQAVAFAQNSRDEVRLLSGDGQVVGALAAQQGMKQTNYIAFTSKDYGADASNDIAPIMRAMPHNASHANGGGQLAVATQMAVRRLTPLECERLQGFPDGWTAISRNGKPAADGPRYKALGNSMAVPVMRWIGKRIQNS